MKGFFGLGKKKEEPKKEEPAQPIPVINGKWILQYDMKACTGAGVCEAVAEKHWKVGEDRKADLVGGKFNPESGMFEKVIDDAELEANKMAADGCPPKCIHIVNRETGERVI